MNRGNASESGIAAMWIASARFEAERGRCDGTEPCRVQIHTDVAKTNRMVVRGIYSECCGNDDLSATSEIPLAHSSTAPTYPASHLAYAVRR